MMTKKPYSPSELEENKNTKSPKGSIKNNPESSESASSQATLHGTAVANQNTATMTSAPKRKGPTTRIVVKFDVGFSNSVYLRGKGANLSWDKGILLKNQKADEWTWETDVPFTSCEFKVLINDRDFEVGDNHPLNCGATVQYTPKF